MRKLVLVAAVVAMMSTVASAGMAPGSFALGFTRSEAPIGIRYQLAEKIAGDVGIGFASVDKDYTAIRVHIGVPIELLAGDKASFGFRPGFSLVHTSYEDDPVLGEIDATNDMAVHAWLFVNYMLTDNLAVTAAHGIDIQLLDGGEGDDMTNFYSVGGDVFELGWYYWF
jgi:hypothetical protein